MNFTEYWKTLSAAERDQAAIVLANRCNTALSTISKWGLGARRPKSRSQNIITNYFIVDLGISTNCKRLFP